jgi:hypothetical protein
MKHRPATKTAAVKEFMAELKKPEFGYSKFGAVGFDISGSGFMVYLSYFCQVLLRRKIRRRTEHLRNDRLQRLRPSVAS